MPESTLLIVWRLKSWPISVGQEKRYDGGPAQSQISACQSSAPGATRRTAVGLILGAPLLGGLRRRAAEPELVFQSVQRSQPPRPAGSAAAAARGRHRAGQGRPDPAAVGGRQCRRRRAIDEERRRDGAGGIPESQHPAPDQGRRRQPARRAAGNPAGARRRRRDHSGPAVCAVGSGDRATDARRAASR